jgi:hypothetical protein
LLKAHFLFPLLGKRLFVVGWRKITSRGRLTC